MGAGKRRATAPIPSMYRLALMILADECPPDGAYYLCRMGCQGELEDVAPIAGGGISIMRSVMAQ